MNSKERVLSTLERRGFDRIPVKHEGTPEVNAQLMECLGVSDHGQLLRLLGDDFKHVGARYVGPALRHFDDGTWEGLWGERYGLISFGNGSYPESVYQPFADVTDPAKLDDMTMPSPDWFDTSRVEADCDSCSEYAVVSGGAGDMDFINGIARCRGVEQVLVDIALEDPVYLKLMDQRFAFFFENHERVLKAAGGKIDIVHVGEDLGSQQGLIMSPRTFERLFAPKFEAFFAMAHSYGARTMMHSCGSVRGLIPRLIEIGLDILDVVQVPAVGMGIVDLHREYGRELCFCGSMCVQSFLPFGTVADVIREVELRLALFAQGGLILGPTHAIQVGTPLENVVAMYRRAGSLSADAHPQF